MIPGVGKALREVDIDDDAFKGIEAIIQSMTPKERANPDIINQSRRLRIAKGSGTKIEEVNRFSYIKRHTKIHPKGHIRYRPASSVLPRPKCGTVPEWLRDKREVLHSLVRKRTLSSVEAH